MSQVSRKKTRRLLLQKLYSRIYGNVDEGRFHESFFDGILTFTLDEQYINEMFKIVVEKQDTIIHIISLYAPKFDVETMLKTNILAMSIAIAEMLYLKEEIPAKVSMDEGIELAKYFGDESCKKIVNGILNSVYKGLDELEKESPSSSNYHFFA